MTGYLVWFAIPCTIVAICCWLSDTHDLEQLDRLFNRPPASGGPPVSPFAGPPGLAPITESQDWPEHTLPFGDREEDLFAPPDIEDGREVSS